MTSTRPDAPPTPDPLNPLEYHVLLALVESPLYGYAIKESVESESRGTVTPRAGSLYRVLARMMMHGFVEEVEPAGGVEPHPGRERKYYALTGAGRDALRVEADRLREAAALADRRLGAAGRRA